MYEIRKSMFAIIPMFFTPVDMHVHIVMTEYRGVFGISKFFAAGVVFEGFSITRKELYKRCG